MASAINKLLGTQKKLQPMQQNNQDMMQQFNKFYRDFMASGKNPMEELQKKSVRGRYRRAHCSR